MTQGISLIFMRAVEILKTFTLVGFFCQWHIKFQLKSTEELCLMALNSDPNFEETLIFCLKIHMRNVVNLVSSGKSENLHFDGLVLT